MKMKWLLVWVGIGMVMGSGVKAEQTSISIDQNIESTGPVNSRIQVAVTGGATRVTVNGNRVENRCEARTGAIADRINQYEQNRDKWHSRHQGVVKRLSEIANKLDLRGCETEGLRERIRLYEDRVAEFAAAFRDFQASLKLSQNYVCGESQGKFLGQVREAQAKLQLVKAKAEALQAYFKEQLRTQLRSEVRACLEDK